VSHARPALLGALAFLRLRTALLRHSPRTARRRSRRRKLSTRPAPPAVPRKPICARTLWLRPQSALGHAALSLPPRLVQRPDASFTPQSYGDTAPPSRPRSGTGRDELRRPPPGARTACPGQVDARATSNARTSGRFQRGRADGAHLPCRQPGRRACVDTRDRARRQPAAGSVRGRSTARAPTRTARPPRPVPAGRHPRGVRRAGTAASTRRAALSTVSCRWREQQLGRLPACGEGSAPGSAVCAAPSDASASSGGPWRRAGGDHLSGRRWRRQGPWPGGPLASHRVQPGRRYGPAADDGKKRLLHGPGDAADPRAERRLARRRSLQHRREGVDVARRRQAPPRPRTARGTCRLMCRRAARLREAVSVSACVRAEVRPHRIPRPSHEARRFGLGSAVHTSSDGRVDLLATSSSTG